jgi:protein ImuB
MHTGMSVICVRMAAAAEPWQELEACTLTLVELAPRVAASADGLVWLDARGLKPATAQRVGREAVRRLQAASGRGWAAGLASVPVAAYVAAGEALPQATPSTPALVVVEGSPRNWLSDRTLEVLCPDPRLAALLEGVGVETCGALASLPREAVEVRFGAEALTLWSWSRGEDERRLFGVAARGAEGSSLDFVDYVVTDPERLVFTTNALLGTVCDALAARGAHARGIRLILSLADGTTWERLLRSARATASRATWLRLARGVLERLTVPDAVSGIAVLVEREAEAGAVQGDLFDPGFGTAAAVESALVRLLEEGSTPLVRPVRSAHPLAERRAHFEDVSAETLLDRRAASSAPAAPAVTAGAPPFSGDERTAAHAEGLTLQLLPTPRRVRVETMARRDHEAPVRYRDRRWLRVLTAAGPDRVSGGQWQDGYAREYFRALGEDGTLVWLYRDGVDGGWYLHGWWD